jgi:hypothetical protein
LILALRTRKSMNTNILDEAAAGRKFFILVRLGDHADVSWQCLPLGRITRKPLK